MVLVWLSLVFGGCASGLDRGASYDRDAEADEEFANAANRPPTPKTLYALARILAAQGRDKECGAVLTRSIRKYPKFLPAYCDLAELHMRNQRSSNAMRVLAAGLSVSRKDATLLNNMGMCHVFRREYERALEMFTRAVAAAPDDGRYRANMAMALGMLGRYEESFSLYRQVLPVADARHNVAALREAGKLSP